MNYVSAAQFIIFIFSLKVVAVKYNVFFFLIRGCFCYEHEGSQEPSYLRSIYHFQVLRLTFGHNKHLHNLCFKQEPALS